MWVGSIHYACILLADESNNGIQRLCAPLGMPVNSLPSFPDAESWYLNVSFCNLTHHAFPDNPIGLRWWLALV